MVLCLRAESVCLFALQITQGAEGLSAGTNIQVAYSDYMINYSLSESKADDVIETYETSQ